MAPLNSWAVLPLAPQACPPLLTLLAWACPCLPPSSSLVPLLAWPSLLAWYLSLACPLPPPSIILMPAPLSPLRATPCLARFPRLLPFLNLAPFSLPAGSKGRNESA